MNVWQRLAQVGIADSELHCGQCKRRLPYPGDVVRPYPKLYRDDVRYCVPCYYGTPVIVERRKSVVLKQAA